MTWFLREKAGLYPYSEEWDKALNEALDDWSVTNVDRYTCWVGPYEVWISNFPHAYGTLYRPELKRLPKRSTRQRLFEAVATAAIHQAQDAWVAPQRIKVGIVP